MPIHFGVKVNEGKYSLKMNRENYAIVNNKSSLVPSGIKEEKIYYNEWCENHLKNCLENYDLSMEFYSLLNHKEFCNEINKFLKKNKRFTEVNNLNEYENVAGYYIMVHDNYCQMYIGTSGGIKKENKTTLD